MACVHYSNESEQLLLWDNRDSSQVPCVQGLLTQGLAGRPSRCVGNYLKCCFLGIHFTIYLFYVSFLYIATFLKHKKVKENTDEVVHDWYMFHPTDISEDQLQNRLLAH